MTEWYPIAFAPKDGSFVQLRDEKRVYSCIMRWNKLKERWEGVSYGPMGSNISAWNEQFCKIYEWAYVDT